MATGAADGYGRMTGKPAATLLHVGCGLSNSMANLHNAKKAHSPVVNIVGDHATYHQAYDAPLATDVPAHAKVCSDWVCASESAGDLGPSGMSAVTAAGTGAGKIATLIVPANHAWEKADTSTAGAGQASHESFQPAPALTFSTDNVRQAAALLSNGKRTGLVLGGRSLQKDALEAAGRVSEAAGADLLCETFPARLQRGEGRVKVQRIPYFAEAGAAFLESYEQLILVGVKPPVAFFAYPGKPSLLAPESCTIDTLVTVDEDAPAALAALADALDAPSVSTQKHKRQEVATPPEGALTPESIGESLCRLLPDNAIVVDEAITCSQPIYTATEGGLQSPMTGWPSPAAPSVSACRWPWGRPLAARIRKSWPSRPTAAPCTPSRPCGPWLGSSRMSQW